MRRAPPWAPPAFHVRRLWPLDVYIVARDLVDCWLVRAVFYVVCATVALDAVRFFLGLWRG